MKQTVGYLRKSRVTSDRHVSWQVQEQAIRDLATKHGDTDLQLLSDWSKSGRGEKTRLRGDYLRLRQMIAANQVRVVYAYSLSRLSRSLGEYASLAELCRDHSVAIRLCKEGEFDYSSPTGRAIIGVLAVFAQMEAELAQERARDTIAVRRARGDKVGSAAYGYRLKGGKEEPDPKQSLELVLEAFRSAGSFAGAARKLNTDRVPSKYGKAWSGKVVAGIVKRVAPHEPSVFNTRQGVKARPKHAFRLYRLLRCPCGNVMTGRITQHTTKYGRFGPYISYQCFRGRYEPSHPRPYMVSERELMPWIKAEAARLQTPPSVTLAESKNKTKQDELEAHRLRVLDNFESGYIDKAERDRRLAKITTELESLDAASRVVSIPQIDWTWPPEKVNDVLRSLWEYVGLDTRLRPVRALWRVPAWRTPDEQVQGGTSE